MSYRLQNRREANREWLPVPISVSQVAQGYDYKGIWETQGYAPASRKVLVIIDNMSSGSVTISHGG